MRKNLDTCLQSFVCRDVSVLPIPASGVRGEAQERAKEGSCFSPLKSLAKVDCSLCFTKLGSVRLTIQWFIG
jgi:hypothetical protein